jgi:hypothetical protein
MFAALVAGVFGLLPRLGWLNYDAAGLRRTRPALCLLAADIDPWCIAVSTSFGTP